MRMVALGELVDIKGGGTPSKDVEAYWGGDIPWASVKDFKGFEITTTVDRITVLGVANSATNIVPANSILVPTRMAVGKAAINTISMAINQDLKALTPRGGVEIRYLLHALLAKGPELEKQATGATVKGITLEVLKSLQIPLPPLEEQKRIAAILDQADDLRRKRQRALDRLNQLGQAIFIEMFGDIRTAYKRYEVRTFEEFADVRLGKMLDRGKSKGGTMRPYLRNANVRWFGFDLSDILDMEILESEIDRFSLKDGDLLICEGGEPGRCAIWFGTAREMYYQKALHRARVDTRVALPYYVAHWFHSAAKFGMLADSVTSATIAHLTGEKIKRLEIGLPPIDQQKKFVSQLNAIDVSRVRFRSAHSSSETLFTSLQHRAFRGEL